MRSDRASGDFRKPILQSEWWFLAHPPNRSPVVQNVVEGVGQLDIADLTAAVAVAAAASPGMRLVRRGRMWVDSGRNPTVRTVPAPPSGQMTELPALHDPLPDRDGSMCEVLWCPGTPSAVVFRGSHAVLDGMGLLMFAQDVFRALRGEPVLGADSTRTGDEIIDALGLPTSQLSPKLDCVSPVGPPSRNRPRSLWRRRTVDGHHPALAAKVATALTDIYGMDPGRFAIAFDLRRHASDIRSTGNLSQSEIYEVPAGRSWHELHERLLTAMAAGREIGGRVESAMLRMPLGALRTMIRAVDGAANNRYASASVLSNLGRVELADFRLATYEPRTVYLLSALTALSPPDVNTVECAGRTEITMTWCNGPGNAERMDEVLDRLEETLSPRAHRSWVGNGTTTEVPADTLVSMFRRQVRDTPDATALRWPDGRQTYAELDRRSESVAGYLRAEGAGPGTVVGLVADRSPATVAAIWGVLKAGAAYLPLDTQHPDVRLAELLADAGAPLCLTHDAYRDRRITPDGCRTVVLDELADRPDADAGAGPGPTDLAYVIYTSGSTGTPKGVEVEHRSLVNYVTWARETFQVDGGTTFGLFTSLAFDLPNTALFTPLLSGGSITLVPDEPNHLSLTYLVEESGATALKLTPSHLDLIERLNLRPTGFRLLVVGGEALRTGVVERAQRLFGPDCRIVNHYGPTETTIGCLTHPYDPQLDATATVVPIGRPMANCTVHLLDPDRRHVAPGEPGEMYLGGAQLARGYRGRPDLDRERFLRLADGTRVYRTGDVARLLPNGEIEFIGRADDQVKIMGHRVEPAEVTHALESHPDISQAAVVARDDPHGAGKRLYAYAVSKGTTDPAELHRYLSELLPRHFVPSGIAFIDRIPHTPNGKLDVRALPDPLAPTDGGTAHHAVDVADPTQNRVRDIWAATLGVDHGRIDGGTDFHQLGGNSILLLSMLAAVSRDVVGDEREGTFMAQLGQIIREPTLDRVSQLARDAVAGA
ncbi:MAG: non-ribosomal peptide synthetase [Actinocatenispora sp.]